MILYFVLAHCVLGYPGGAPGFDHVLNDLRPGGPHTETWFKRDRYGYNHHHVRLEDWVLNTTTLYPIDSNVKFLSRAQPITNRIYEKGSSLIG